MDVFSASSKTWTRRPMRAGSSSSWTGVLATQSPSRQYHAKVSVVALYLDAPTERLSGISPILA